MDYMLPVLTGETPDIKLYHGDARNLDLPDLPVDLTVTSPPYYNARLYSSWPTYGNWLEDMARVWSEVYRVTTAGGRLAVVLPQGYGRNANKANPEGWLSMGADTEIALQDAGWQMRGVVIWDKRPSGLSTAWGSWQSASNPTLRDAHELILIAHKETGRREPVGVSTISSEDFLLASQSIWSIAPANHPWHPAVFPVRLVQLLIEFLSYRDDLILDPFAGSGTTLRVAASLGRRAIGIELDEVYCQRAWNEVAQLPLFCQAGDVE